MRRYKRVPLDGVAKAYLRKRRVRVKSGLAAGNLNSESEWNGARQTKTMNRVLAQLQVMAGPRQRCMYCLDSHGTDIEHFWPKGAYPRLMFHWSNLLLCCTDCGRIKGTRFPLAGHRPLLVNPAKEDPWRYLEFDPITGNLTARYDNTINDYDPKGEATVDALQLDKREAMSLGYLKTWRRLTKKVRDFLAGVAIALPNELIEADDHGLLCWAFHHAGQNEAPFKELRQHHPAVWAACRASLANC